MDVWKNDVLEEPQTGFLIGPVIWGVENVEAIWEAVFWVASSCLGKGLALAGKFHQGKLQRWL